MGSFSQSDKRLVFSKQQLVSNQHDVIIKQGFYMILKINFNEFQWMWQQVVFFILTSIPGKGVTSDPVAIKIFLVWTSSVLPSSLWTVTLKIINTG